MATNSIKLLTGNSYPQLAQLVADRYVSPAGKTPSSPWHAGFSSTQPAQMLESLYKVLYSHALPAVALTRDSGRRDILLMLIFEHFGDRTNS